MQVYAIVATFRSLLVLVLVVVVCGVYDFHLLPAALLSSKSQPEQRRCRRGRRPTHWPLPYQPKYITLQRPKSLLCGWLRLLEQHSLSASAP